jgi:hypothetical protein
VELLQQPISRFDVSRFACEQKEVYQEVAA